MAPDTIPYELKRLIYDYVDLQTIKSLRQVSRAWASVGVELLLLSSFHIKSHSLDVQRLIDIGSSPAVSLQAAKTIKRIVFQNSRWSPRYFRKIVCSRHEHRSHYDAVDFVPTQEEQGALDELDVTIAQKDQDDKEERRESRLMLALRGAPQVNSIKIECRNPFQNPILRKVWEEYALEAYRTVNSRPDQLLGVISAAVQVGLPIEHFIHDQLLSSCFENDDLVSSVLLWEELRGLKSLNLVISDLDATFSADDRAVERLRQWISSFPALEDLSVHFETLDAIPTSFLSKMATGTLHVLSLGSVSVEPVEFTAFLEGNLWTLKRLRLRFVDIPQGHGTWQEFLENLRDLSGDKLEKFQLSGMVRSVDGESEQWLLWSRYDEKWNVMPKERSPRTREIEDFVLRGGAWPMVPSDSMVF